MCKPRLKCSLGSLARLSTLSQSYLLTASIYIFVLSSVYLVEYTLHQNLMIEIHTGNFDLHITVPSPNLAFLCRNLDYKPYSINQSIYDLCCIIILTNNTVSHHYATIQRMGGGGRAEVAIVLVEVLC